MWYRKHYKMLCMIFLGVLLVGWTTFINHADKAASQEVPGKTVTDPDNVSPTPSGDITQTADSSTSEATDVPATAEPAPATDVPAATDAPTAAATPDLIPTDVPATDIPEPTAEPQPTAEPTAEPTTEPTPTEAPVDPGLTITFKYALANVESRLNIRSGAGTDYSTIAYLKPLGYCEVLEWGSEWTKIKSGGVTGYVYTVYLMFNDDALNKLRSLNKIFVRVTSNTVNIRSEANTDSTVLGKGSLNSKYIYLPEKSVEGWYAIQFSETQTGYITGQYSEIYIDTSTAIPLS
ncbi:MAG: hypothetical protein IK001_00795 [Lachnospiraceae bacterium]|nr:hypothetical protein [Lachnospiraceae bacterium]